MGDDTNTFPAQGRSEGGGRGNRSGSGNRDNGGFRIRLSDNEMQAARALQEAFQLRSTVAVLGFSLRTLAQQLEAGQLDELVAQHRAQGGGRAATPRSERGGERGGERRGGERERPAASRGPRVDPFARPAKPAPATPASEPSELNELGDDQEDSAAAISEAESEVLSADVEVSSAESAEAVEQAS